MRIKIVLDGRKSSLTLKGFPVCFHITKNKNKKLIRTGYYSEKEHWDKINALPKKKHPNYVDFLNYLEQKKITVQKLLADSKLESINILEADKILTQSDSDIFYEDARRHITNRASKVALESFQKTFPSYTFSEITPLVVKNYMNKLLVTPIPNGSKRSPNGVISYLNSLTALWNKCEKKDNPFSGIRPKPIETKSKSLLISDMIKIRDNDLSKHYNSKGGGTKNYLNYLLLCFYLGGIDMIDLANMRYDKNVYNNRVEFHRSKGGTNVFVSNFIFPESWEILKKYDCKPYLIPLMKENNYHGYIANMSRYFEKIKNKLDLSALPYSKSPRYTFINRAQNLLIDERIAISIVGHSQQTTHSIYKSEFPQSIKDRAHKKIIDFTVEEPEIDI